MMIKRCSNIAAAVQGQVYGNGSVGNDTTMAMHSALNCSSQGALTFDYILKFMLLES
jgi:hypothetical protein